MANERITLTKSYDTGDVVLTLDATNMTESYEKIITDITPPKSTNRQVQDTTSGDFGPSTTKIVDLLRVRRLFEIDGLISQGGYSGDTNTDVVDRKNDLRNMFLAGGALTFTYDDRSDISGVIDSLEIEKLFTDTQVSDFKTDESGYRFKMTIIEGVDFS